MLTHEALCLNKCLFKFLPLGSNVFFKKEKQKSGEFPGSPVVRTCAVQYSQKEKKQKKKTSFRGDGKLLSYR